MSTTGGPDPLETGEWAGALSAAGQHRGCAHTTLRRPRPVWAASSPPALD